MEIDFRQGPPLLLSLVIGLSILSFGFVLKNRSHGAGGLSAAPIVSNPQVASSITRRDNQAESVQGQVTERMPGSENDPDSIRVPIGHLSSFLGIDLLTYDALFEQFSPGEMAVIGVSPDQTAKINEAIMSFHSQIQIFESQNHEIFEDSSGYSYLSVPDFPDGEELRADLGSGIAEAVEGKLGETLFEYSLNCLGLRHSGRGRVVSYAVEGDSFRQLTWSHEQFDSGERGGYRGTSVSSAVAGRNIESMRRSNGHLVDLDAIIRQLTSSGEQ